MSRIVYVNGEFLPADEASISIFDRGFLFADGVYEVVPVLNGRLIDNDPHLARLRRSMDELDMPAPCSDAEIESAELELVQRNELVNGLIYLQVTRGSAERDFAYPANPKPSLVMLTQVKNPTETDSFKHGIRVISVPDIRWKRRDIKTIGLLAPCMAKMEAKRAGVDDAWMVEDGFVTEGSSNNAYIVTHEGVIITRHLGPEILAGITRQVLLTVLEDSEIRLEERPFSIEEAHAAAEAFLTSATTFVTPVIEIDGKPIGNGEPGPVTRQLQTLYTRVAFEQAG
ncbi:MAG: D-amino-acid transaminase [Gammaproteobacteria bacterium]